MKVHLVLQPFEDDRSLYEELAQALTDEQKTELTVVVAWAKESGLRRIRPLLKALQGRGGTARILLGIDEGGATIEGLRAALNDFDEARVLHDTASGTFHPKIYVMDGEASSTVIIASNNMTRGGLFANYEAGTCLDLDLTQATDLQVHQVVSEYTERLREDETSRPLTDDLIRQLLEDPRFDIGTEDQSDTMDDDDSHGVSPRLGKGPRLFGKSHHAKKRDPVPSRRIRTASQPIAGGISRATPVEGGSTAAVIARWRKKLTRSDSGRPRAGSQTTAALRFTKANQPIDQGTWFREILFVDEPWHSDSSRIGRQIVEARFDVTIDGIPRGTHELQLKYDAVRDANQRNFTTDLKWGSLNPVLRSENLFGKWATVEKLSDGALRLIVADEPAGEFLA